MTRGLPVPNDSQGRNVLHVAMFVRGLDAEAVAAEAGVSARSVQNAASGKPITAPILSAITRAVRRHPVDPELRALLDGELETKKGDAA